MTPPFTLPLDIEVWADREDDLKALMAELNSAEDEKEPEGVG